MATKKKTSKRPMKAKRTAHKKATPKKLVKRQKAVKRPKKVAKKKSAPKKAAKKRVAAKKPARKRRSNLDPVTFAPLDSGSRSGELSGDLQGLSNRESADSESVDELVEEGNAFEAEVVDGVERAGDEDEKEVRTREVPEDDVPGEYLDEE
jgi:DNA-nicking Smr family endonuclease